MSDTINSNIQGFSALVEQQAAAAQMAVNSSPNPRVLNFAPGAVLRGVLEAVAGVALWLQAMVLQLLLVTRAATSTGADLDSWMADFSVVRVPPASARCTAILLSRYSSNAAVTILTGGLVMTSDGSQQYTIVADPTQSAYGAGGYTMAAGVSACQVTVNAATPGSAANVAAGTITQFASGVIGADTVTNTLAATGGADAETDTALRARFRNYLVFLWKATIGAIQYAAQSVQAGLTTTLIENYDEAGNWKPGYFYVVADDGTGLPPASLLAAIAVQVDLARGATISFAVHGPAELVVNLVATINVSKAGYLSGQVQAAATAAATAFINASVLGQNLAYFPAGNAISTVPGVAELVSLTLDGTQADVVVTGVQKIVAGTVTIFVAGS